MENNNQNINSDNNETLTMTLRLMGFLNASHYAVFNGKRGQTHSHSWQLQFEVEVPVNGKGLVRFEDLEKLINSVLKPYQRTVLNDMEPFDRFQPFTENIAAHFFNYLSDLLTERGSRLTKLVAWENPTKGVEVTQRIPYHLLAGQEPGLQFTPHVTVPPSVLNDTDFIPAATANNEVLAELAASYDALDSDTIEDELVQVEEQETGSAAEPEVKKTQPRIAWWKIAIIIGFILATAVVIYHPLLFTTSYQVYPWGSDTWGHLYKAKFLAEQIAQGNYYPQFSADWYNGNQPFRYWAPLPYYVLAGLYGLTSNLFVAGNYYIVLCAVIGALGWLSWRKRLPWGICILLAVIWMVWPDNVRVALSEGNFPRVLATALLPWLVSSYINSLKKDYFWGSLLVTIILIHLVILCHAMIGAVYCVALFLFTVFDWIFGGTSLKGAGRGVVALVLGVLTSAWWLLPALSGGLIGMGSDATAGGIQYISFKQAFNPLLYRTNRETYYLGISLLPLLIFMIVNWKKKPALSKALFITGLLLTVITFPSFSWLQKLMPLSGILWPLRFRSIAGLMLLVSASAVDYELITNLFTKRILTWVTVGLLLLVIIDSGYAASQLIFTRVMPYEVTNVSNLIKSHSGWRVATLDISSLGSGPAYIFANEAKREQVFGWAWQGAATSANIMLLNTALQNKLYPYVIRQLYYLGASDIVSNDKTIKDPKTLNRLLQENGFQAVNGYGSRIGYWHGIDKPYFILNQPTGMVIGKYASMYAMQFPSLQIGNSVNIDEYSLQDLRQYQTLILTGADWVSRTQAEKLIIAYARQGGHVIVDLTGFPVDVFSKQPKFLGVYGQPVSLRGPLQMNSKDGDTITWVPFSASSLPWSTLVPLPLDNTEWSFNYLNNPGILFGYKQISGTKIGFIGGNPIYHLFLTGDPAVKKWLSSQLDLNQDFKKPQIITVQEYQVEPDGFSFNYFLSNKQKVVVPVAMLDGMQAYVDGKHHQIDSYENLVTLDLPNGYHTLRLRVKTTSVYRWGGIISLITGLVALIFLFMLKDVIKLSNTILLNRFKKEGMV